MDCDQLRTGPQSPGSLAAASPGQRSSPLRRLIRHGHSSRALRGMVLAAFAALITLPLAGCDGLRERRPLVLYIVISTPGGERITRDMAITFETRFQQVVSGFRRFHPNVVVQLSLYPEDQLLRQIRQRTASGLGPDLIITSSELGHALLRQRQTVPMPLERGDADEIDPVLLQRVSAPDGRIAALPLILYTQLACFNRQRMPQPPATVRQLLQQSAEGARVGMALPLRSLFWSAGSLGALPALRAAAEGRAPDAAQRQGLLTWLRWLQSANIQKNITFVGEDLSLREGFRRGHYDWISCGSSDLVSLEEALGDNLGISTLPDGDSDHASPVNPLRVLALGRDSSGDQRRMAIALSRYSLRPLVQRIFTLENRAFLPVNRHVTVPVESSRLLATLVAARRQGEGAAALLARLHATDPRVGELDQVIVSLVFGLIEPETAMKTALSILSQHR